MQIPMDTGRSGERSGLDSRLHYTDPLPDALLRRVSPHLTAPIALQEQLARTARLHARRRDQPALAAALRRLARWQALRLRQTYADLAAQPRYAAAIRFFENDLYGGGDFEARDADLARVVPMMVRMLPARVIHTVAEAVELNALSHELDAALIEHLSHPDADIDVAAYCRAYRTTDRRRDRERQIQLIGSVGSALDVHVRKPLVRSALVMMRKPAHLSGFGALHQFLERGFGAFRGMHGAEAFLAIITERESALMERIFAGDAAPFENPAVTGSGS